MAGEAGRVVQLRLAALHEQLSALHTAGPAARAARLAFPGAADDHAFAAAAAGVDSGSTVALADRRARSIGPGSESLSYGSAPVHAARGEGTWIIEEGSGRRLLDMYNNVPGVGHSHPRVACAIAAQARKVSLNMRMLHGGAPCVSPSRRRSTQLQACTATERSPCLGAQQIGTASCAGSGLRS